MQRARIVLLAKGVEHEITYIDRDQRPEWFKAASPHGKVPVLLIDGKDALFESNAIAEYLDDTVLPRLHPEDPMQRARNRAWTDFLPGFSGASGKLGSAPTEAEFNAAVEKLAGVFSKLEDALAVRGNDGPYFNGSRFSLVDAGYAPFLQRHTFLDRLHPVGVIVKFPRLAAWRDALLAAPAVKASTVPEIENLWREGMVRRKGWIAQFVAHSNIAKTG